MKKCIIILFSMLLLNSYIVNAQINPIKRPKQKTEQTKGQKKKQSSKKGNTHNQSKANDSEAVKEKAIQTAKNKAAEAAKSVADELSRSDVKTITANGVSFDMVCVDGGSFMMGGTPEQGVGAYSDARIVHHVTLSSYYICKCEVTQALWQAVMGQNPSSFKGDSSRPVEQVSWDDCQKFIARLNAITGKSFRLPSEAEWEFAARGGNKSHGYKYAGANSLEDIAWYSSNSNRTTHSVGLKSPNELGLYDMSGNVGEWCQDWYGDAYYSNSPSVNPKGPYSGRSRIHRGGRWDKYAADCSVWSRNCSLPSNKTNYIGLRLAATIL